MPNYSLIEKYFFFCYCADKYLGFWLLIRHCRFCFPITNKTRIEPFSALINRHINSYSGGEQLVPINVILRAVRICLAPDPWLLKRTSHDICSLPLPQLQILLQSPSSQPECSLLQSRTNYGLCP